MTAIDIGADLGVGRAAPGRADKRLGGAAIRVAGGVASAGVSLGAVLLAWWGFLKWFHVKPFIGKGPVNVYRYLVTSAAASEHRRLLFGESRTTLRDAMLGLVAGTAAALVCAAGFNLSRSMQRTLMPIAMVLRSVPLVAMTPLIVLVFGRGLPAITVISGIVTFFPTLVNVTLALRATPKESIDLLTAYGASRAMTLWKVQVPSALPALFASLRIAAPLALVGALLAEWLATGKGLGYQILQSAALSNYSGLWARVAAVTFYSVMLYKMIGIVERLVLRRYARAYGR